MGSETLCKYGVGFQRLAAEPFLSYTKVEGLKAYANGHNISCFFKQLGTESWKHRNTSFCLIHPLSVLEIVAHTYGLLQSDKNPEEVGTSIILAILA